MHDALKLDPRTKLYMLLIVNVISLSHASTWMEMLLVALGCVVLILYKCFGLLKRFVFAYGVLLIFEMIIMNHPSQIVSIVLGFFTVFKRFLPMIMYGSIMIKTTSVGELTLAMEKLRLSRKIVIPICVLFRFFPTVIEEWRSIREAMRLKDIRYTPITLVEYTMVPLLNASIKIGEELSAAALSRGFTDFRERTYLVDIRLKFIDKMVMLMYSCLPVFMLGV